MKISTWVTKKRRILCWFQIRRCRLNQMPQKKLEPKNYAKFEYFRFCAFFCGFLLLNFVRGISESRHQRIWNQHKIMRFFDTHIDIFQEKNFWVIMALMQILNANATKNCIYSNIFQKVKSYFFVNVPLTSACSTCQREKV